MAKSTSSNYKTKKEAQNALDRFKMEVASEIGVNLKDGYNGCLLYTSPSPRDCS